MTDVERLNGHLESARYTMTMQAQEIERQKHTIADLANNNVSLVALIHDLEKQLREAKRKPD